MRRAWRVAELVVLPTIGLGAALVIAPGRAEQAFHVWLLVVLGLAAFAFIGIVGSAYPRTPSPFDASLRPPPAAVGRPESLLRLEREVTIAVSSDLDVHQRLRPAVAGLATGLLASRRGIDLERDPERARAELGEDVWALVRPDRPHPSRDLGGGIDAAALTRIVESLERI